MLRVYVKPTAIWITPYKKYSVPALEKGLSVWDPMANRYVNYLYSFEKDDPKDEYGVLKIPKGYGLDVVENILQQNGVVYNVIDDTSNYPIPKKINLELLKQPKSKVQEDAIQYLKKEQMQLFLALDVGMGKTYCCVNLACSTRVTTMVISYGLSEQWYKRIFEYTNAINGKSVIMISSTAYLEDIVKGKTRPNAGIYLVSISTLMLYMNKYGKDSIQKIADVLGIGLKIFDEAHVRYLQFNDIDLNMQVAKTIYLSATPGRSQYNEDKMFKKIYSHVETFGSFTQKLNDYYIIRYLTMDSHSTAKDRSVLKSARGFSSLKYTDYLFTKYHNEVLEMVMTYAKPILDEDKKGKILIVVDWLKYIDSAKQYLCENYPEYSCGAYCNIIKDKIERQQELDKRIIFGTIGSMQNGRDIENLRAIFAFTQFSSSIVAQQLLGRLRRIPDKDVFYYDISDRSIPDTLNMRFRRGKIFNDRAKGEIFNDYIDLDRF